MDFFVPQNYAPTTRQREGLLIREGFQTARQGYPAMELGFPLVQREDLPEYRSNDGTQFMPTFYNKELPWYTQRSGQGIKLTQPGRMLTPHDAVRMAEKDPSFRNGHYYPWGRDYNFAYPKLPEIDYRVPIDNPSNFKVQSDELRKWLLHTRG